MLGSLTTRNPTSGTLKPRRLTSTLKYLETGITLLLAAESLNNKWALLSSPSEVFKIGSMFFSKYPSHTRVTIDPEAIREGTSLP